ncbi:response regulator [Halorubrum ezzemoulense]|uniref:response regulator n=1 Tax=Halorubrum ezzemoulense TaxID=337243 RepID=UPI0023310731|nr:response regulator [Halorubrum ezzemoulense]MDB9235343.1 response regulator [Halorubrum ezzemoulense]
MTDQTPPSETHADTTAATDRVETTVSEENREAPIAVLQIEPDARSAELFETFAERITDRVHVRSVKRLADGVDTIETGIEVGGERVAVDCVVTEQRLPDGHGVDLTERLREVDPALPVVFHSTCPSEECEAAAFGAGADAYFEKGSDRGRYDAILDRIRALADAQRREEGGTGTAATPRTAGSTGETLRSEE